MLLCRGWAQNYAIHCRGDPAGPGRGGGGQVGVAGYGSPYSSFYTREGDFPTAFPVANRVSVYLHLKCVARGVSDNSRKVGPRP